MTKYRYKDYKIYNPKDIIMPVELPRRPYRLNLDSIFKLIAYSL